MYKWEVGNEQVGDRRFCPKLVNTSLYHVFRCSYVSKFSGSLRSPYHTECFIILLNVSYYTLMLVNDFCP